MHVGKDYIKGYYDLIERRVDILRSFPSITVEDKNGNTRNGFLVDVLIFKDKKVPVICVKDEIASFMNVANDNYNIYVEQVESYILPSSSIIRKNNKDYVFVLNAGDFQELVEVKIYKKEGWRKKIKCIFITYTYYFIYYFVYLELSQVKSQVGV